jgi:hypothetical protein
MVCLDDSFSEVNLFTYSKELQELMLTEYPGVILENQHRVDTSKERHLFSFYNLNPLTLRPFLHGLNFEYELRNSKTGALVT